jgi:16S rRNA (guanine527-N7)-methyltransferase
VNEEDAKDWVRNRFGAAALTKLSLLAGMVVEESARQNLIAASTIETLWARHIVDSAQLLTWDQSGPWLDIGTGAGFPGLVIAAIRGGVTMVEPRRRRVEFLERCIGALGLSDRNDIRLGKVETLPSAPSFSVISARAVAALPALVVSASHCATPDTIWLLPKGRNAADEVAEAQRTWHGMFHVEHSVTDPASLIVIARGVRRR